MSCCRAGRRGGGGRDELARRGGRRGRHHGHGARGQREPRGGRRRDKDTAAARDGTRGALRGSVPVPPRERGEHAAEHPREDHLGQGRRGFAGTSGWWTRMSCDDKPARGVTLVLTRCEVLL